MRCFILVIIFVLEIDFLCLAKELRPLDELKQIALENNLDLKIKKQEIMNYKVEDSIFEKVRFASSYNFETNSTFVGVIASVPLSYFKAYKEELKYRDLLFAKECQKIFKEIEDIYYNYLKFERTRKEYKLDLKQRQFVLKENETLYESDRIKVAELILHQLSVLEIEHKLMGVENDMAGLETGLKRTIGAEDIYGEGTNTE